jgi:inhibitor of cysteine peptidase
LDIKAANMKKIATLVLVISLFSCSTHKSLKSDYKVNKNEIFEITLKSNPTTGYSWKWIKEQPSKIIDSVSSTYVKDKSEPKILGVGGNEIWKFKGKETGVETLVFEYCRSWEKNSTIETKKFVVEVK